MENILPKVKIKRGCWEWQGEISNWGYGVFYKHGKTHYAHRYFYELFVGKIPKGFQVDHLCFNKKCVNPKHLEAVTEKENHVRANKEKARKNLKCPQGHSYSGENLYIIYDKKRGRTHKACRACKILADKRWIEKVGKAKVREIKNAWRRLKKANLPKSRG